MYEGKPFLTGGVPDPDALVFTLAAVFNIPPFFAEDVPVDKLLRFMREFEKRLSRLGDFYG